METLLPWIGHYGYPALFFLLMLGIVGIPLPDEGLLIFAGYLVYKGHLQLAPALASASISSRNTVPPFVLPPIRWSGPIAGLIAWGSGAWSSVISSRIYGT